MSEQELPPGRALDAQIAETVMEMGSQWTVQQQSDGTFTPTGEVWYQCPEFSTDIRDAWQVVERIETKGWFVEVGWCNAQYGPERRAWCYVGEYGCDELYVGEAYENTAPLAICRAALKALRREAE